MTQKSISFGINQIQRRIFVLRDIEIMLSSDLAELYGVEPRVLNQAVKRNIERFPSDFMFQLTPEEFEILKSHFVTSSWGGVRRALPYAFTEHGILMLSSVLRSPQAIQINIEIMRAFIDLRNLVRSNKKLARQVKAMESRYDDQFSLVFKALRQLMKPKSHSTPRIGFRT
jgi:hypothetical protein